MDLNIQATDVINMYANLFSSYWPIISLALALYVAPKLYFLARGAVSDYKYDHGYLPAHKTFRVSRRFTIPSRGITPYRKRRHAGSVIGRGRLPWWRW